MTEVPKIVHRRLRASALRQGNQPHPDAEMMAAFVEQALSSNERGAVLEHMALCVDCRDIVLLALPADERIASPAAATFETAPVMDEVSISRSGRGTAGNSFAWANLLRPNLLWANMRWAALATGVAVAIFGVYVGLEHRSQTNSPIATATPAPTFSRALAPQQDQSAAEVATQLSANTTSELRPPETTSPGAISKAQPSHPSARHANNRQPVVQPVAPTTSSASSSGVVASNRSAVGDQSANQGTKETIGASNDLLAMNQAPPIERAKPAPEESRLVNAPAQSAQDTSPQTSPSTTTTLQQDTAWSISAGVLQRSLDGGRTWQPILAGTIPEGKKAWLCYGVSGQNVWVAGQGGALKHSANGGESWSSVMVTKDGNSLNADVTRIKVRDSGEVALSTATHETWVTRDNGKTWDKQ